MNEGDDDRTPHTTPHVDNYEEAINFSCGTSRVEVTLTRTPTIKVNGFTIFDGLDLDNAKWVQEMKKGKLPAHVVDAIAKETGSSTEEVSNAYATAVNDATQPSVAGTLNPDAWFTGEENPKFVPFLCAQDYLRVFPHVVTEYGGLMHQFTGKFWLKSAEGFAKSSIEKAGDGTIRPRQIQEAIESLRNLTRITDPDKMDLPMERIMPLPNHIIPLDAGLFSLDARALLPHSPDYYYTECLPRKYIPGSTPEIFLSFLEFLFEGDPDAELKKTQIFETIAWTLMPGYSIHGTVILFGQGGEGKSIVHQVITDLLLHTTSLSLTELEGDKFKRAELQGSWANLVSESTTEIITSEWFKRLTDGTVFTADRKNGQPFQFSSRAKLIIDVNELPNKDKELRAFYRRVITIIDFPNQLESVLTPVQISEFVEKMKDPVELDRIFSYTVEHFYAPLTSRMKFTGHLSVADAEKKWQERSNPAKSYITMKNESGGILTDVNAVKKRLNNDSERQKRYITHESSGDEYLTMVKQDVVTDAVKWASDKGFPAKSIHAGSLGAALLSMGFPNQTVSKKINKDTILKAWRDIYIHIDHGEVTDPVTDPKKPPLPPPNQSRIDEMNLGNGYPFPCARTVSENNNGGEDKEPSVTKVKNSLNATASKEVTGTFADPLPQPLPRPLSDNAKATADPIKPNVQSENEGNEGKQTPITLEDGKLIIDQLLNLGYHIDPNSGPDINQIYFKIGVLRIRSLPSDKREKLENIMHQEHFTLFSSGSMGIWWFTRPLVDGTKEGAPHD